MRGRMLIFLFLLCLFLAAFFAGITDYQTRNLEQERVRIENEIELLEAENAYLRSKVQELQNRQSEVLYRMEEWLDSWEVGEFEATAYTLECGNGDGYTATMTTPQAGRTIAVDPKMVPLGSSVYIPGVGWQCAEDTGGAIRGKIIDLYMGTGLEARTLAYRWGRQKVKVVYQKWAGGEDIEAD